MLCFTRLPYAICGYTLCNLWLFKLKTLCNLWLYLMQFVVIAPQNLMQFVVIQRYKKIIINVLQKKRWQKLSNQLILIIFSIDKKVFF